MMSLLINKKTAILILIVLSFLLPSYAMATLDASFEGIDIEEVNPNYLYNRNSTFYVDFDIKNTGTEIIPYKSLNIRIYAGDFQIGSLTSSELGIGESWKNKTFCRIPKDIPYGVYTIWGKLFMEGDTNSKNNTAFYSQDIIITPPTPSTQGVDLCFLSVKALSDIVNPGGIIKFEYLIVNIGSETSDNSVVNFSIGSHYIGSMSCVPLSGEKYIINETEPFSIPSDIPSGYYVVTAEIVCPNESVTNNNIGQSIEKIRMATPVIDLSINNILFTGNKFRQGDSINIITSIINTGTSKAENISIECYIGESLIGNTYLSELGPEQNDNFMIECKIPEDLSDGYYTIVAIASCSDDADMSNNSGISDSIWIGKYTDLEVKSIQATNGTFMPKDTYEVYNLVENVGDKVSNAYTIDFYMSTDKNISAMDYRIGRIERKGLEPGEQHSYNTTLKLPPNLPVGNYYVGVKVTCNEEGNLDNNSGLDNETVGIIHPANYVCGHITYEYTGQNDQVVRYAYLKILDSGSKRVIAETYTDDNGNYGEEVLRDEASTNIYIQVYTEGVNGSYPGTIGKICSVKDDVYHLVFSQKSSSFTYPQNSSRVINLRIPISGRAFMVFDSMVEAFIQAKEYFGIEMEPITACWPSPDNGTYYYPGEGIFISYDDEWDRDIILHEYGHYIAEVYDFCQGSVGENPTHAWNVDLREYPVQRTAEHAANLTFRESWPTLFSIASQYYTSVYPHSGDTKYQDYYSYYNWTYEFDLEEDTFDKGSPGEYYENMNCCALWDIFDDHSDSGDFIENISDPNFTKIWSVLRGYKTEDMNDFWVGWFHHFGQNEDKDGIINILQEHRMSFAQSGTLPQLPQNHAPIANAGQDITVAQDRAEGALVHLNASGSSDSDGDELSYVWRYGAIPYIGKQVDIVLPVGKSEIELEVSDGKITTWDTVKVIVTPK